MANLVAVSPAHHRQLRILTDQLTASCATVQLLPVVPAEFASVATQSPLVLCKNGQTGQFGFATLLGFYPGENLFWQQGQFQGLYQPLQLRRQPFFVGDGQSPTDIVVCIDLTHPAVVAGPALDQLPPAAALFDDAGQATVFYQQAQACLQQLLHGEDQQRQLVALLLQYELVQPLLLDITFGNQQQLRLTGLYTIDEARLAALPVAAVAQLHQGGWLAPIYTLLASAAQIYPLIERKNHALAVAR